MRLNKLNLAIKLALEIKPPEPIKPLEFANINQEKGIQIFVDEYGIHYETNTFLELNNA